MRLTVMLTVTTPRVVAFIVVAVTIGSSFSGAKVVSSGSRSRESPDCGCFSNLHRLAKPCRPSHVTISRMKCSITMRSSGRASRRPLSAL